MVKGAIQMINKAKRQNIFQIILTGFVVIVLSSCGSYSTQFVCPDAKGANCTSMGRVHEMIESGEIELYNEQKGKCKGKNCQKYNGIKTPKPRKSYVRVNYISDESK